MEQCFTTVMNVSAFVGSAVGAVAAAKSGNIDEGFHCMWQGEYMADSITGFRDAKMRIDKLDAKSSVKDKAIIMLQAVFATMKATTLSLNQV
jgi:hypothetical protein